MASSYLPLQILQHETWTRELDFLQNLLTLSDYIFLHPDISQTQQELNIISPEEMLLLIYQYSSEKEKYPHLYKLLHEFYTLIGFHMAMKKDNASLDMLQKSMTDFRMMILPQIWAQHKQVYCFDSDFLNMLYQTSQLKIYPALLKRLPYSSFYIELPSSYGFHGVFVYVHVFNNNEICIEMQATYLNGKTRHFYRYKFQLKDIQDDNGILFYEYTKKKIHNRNDIADNFFLNFILQATMYLCSKKPDIDENPIQKHIYRKSNIIRNKYSEIRKWDVGLRIGNTFRLQQQNTSTQTTSSLKSCSTKRPHTRKAHWSHYRTGKGRTQIELRWIEPIFIHGKTNIITTKHNVM